MFVKPYFKRVKGISSRAQNGYPPDVLATLYNFPKVSLPAAPYVALIELGGGYNPTNINAWCKTNGYPNPNLIAVGVDGARNSWTGDSNSPECSPRVRSCDRSHQ